MTLHYAIAEGFMAVYYWYDPSPDGDSFFSGLYVKNNRIDMQPYTEDGEHLGLILSGVTHKFDDGFYAGYGSRCRNKEEATSRANLFVACLIEGKKFMSEIAPQIADCA